MKLQNELKRAILRCATDGTRRLSLTMGRKDLFTTYLAPHNFLLCSSQMGTSRARARPRARVCTLCVCVNAFLNRAVFGHPYWW